MYKDVCVCGTFITPSHNHPGFPQLQLECFLLLSTDTELKLGLNKLGFVHGPRLHTKTR